MSIIMRYARYMYVFSFINNHDFFSLVANLCYVMIFRQIWNFVEGVTHWHTLTSGSAIGSSNCMGLGDKKIVWD